MLLSAGRGERMEPLSSWLPKPALEVLARPLLAAALTHLQRAGASPIVANLHRHPVAVAAAVRSCESNTVPVRFSFEPELLGGAGGIAAARRLFASGPALVANADVDADLDLAPLLDAGAPGSIVLGVLPHPDVLRWGRVQVAGDGRVMAIEPPGEGEPGYHFTGFQLIGEDALAALPAPPAAMADVWRPLMVSGRLRAAVLTGVWREAGTPAAYLDVVVARLGGRAWVHDEARVAPDAGLSGAAVGRGCRVGASTTLEATVVTAGATVAAGCRLRRCVVAGPVEVAPDTTLEGRLVLPDGIVAL
jgi:mannose-1-phosphate guanylyltransferase